MNSKHSIMKRDLNTICNPLDTITKWNCCTKNLYSCRDGKSMMAKANFPISFWGDALLVANHIINWISYKSIATTPYERLIRHEPNLSYLQTWDSTTYVHETSSKYGKLGLRGKGTIIRDLNLSKRYVLVG